MLARAIRVAASLMVTTGLVGLTLDTAALHDARRIFVDVLALVAGSLSWQSTELIDAVPGAPRVVLGALVVALVWLGAGLMVVIVLRPG
jgi:ABC-type sugar transport system permease subunit